MYISGVSTHKVLNNVEQLCGTYVPKSFVSKLTAELNPMIKEFRYRSLSKTEFPYVELMSFISKLEKTTELSLKAVTSPSESTKMNTEK